MTHCNICRDIPDAISEDAFASTTTDEFAKCNDTLTKIGGYVSDTYDVYLKQCPGCGTYYKYEYFDSFGSGGGVGGRLERLSNDKAAKELAKDILEALTRMSSYMGKDYYTEDIKKLKELQFH